MQHPVPASVLLIALLYCVAPGQTNADEPSTAASQADEAIPGPLYLQGDHTAVSYQNIVLGPVLKGDSKGDGNDELDDRSHAARKRVRPNVVWIISDDLGPELDCYGYHHNTRDKPVLPNSIPTLQSRLFGLVEKGIRRPIEQACIRT